jgi:hypothetical protein
MFNSLLKNLSESFDALRTNGERFELPEKFPFHAELVEAFFAFFNILSKSERELIL